MASEIDTLPFDENKQMAFFGHLFNEANGLYKQFRYLGSPDWFTRPSLQDAWKCFQEYTAIVKAHPTPISLSQWSYMEGVLGTKEKVKACRGTILAASERTKFYGVEIMRHELELWMQARLLHKCNIEAQDYFNKSKFVLAAEVFRKAVKEFNGLSSHRYEDKRLDSTDEIVSSFQSQTYVKFGLEGIDRHLAPDSANGGLAKGDQTLLLAPQNVGKTTTLVTVSMHNVLDGRYVLFQSHEGKDTDIRMKGIRCAMSIVTVPQLAAILQTPPDSPNLVTIQEVFRESAATLRGTLDLMTRPHGDMMRNIYQQFMAWISDRFYYRPVNRPGMTVEDVIPVIERAHDDVMSARQGEGGFDLFASDYPGLLGSKRSGRDFAYRQVLDLVYREYVQLALMYKWHSLCAIQGNREAGKINAGIGRGRDSGHRFLITEDIAEAYGPGQSATNVITANRSPTDESMGRITYYISKSRSSRTKLAVTAYDRMAQGASHSNEFGWASYYHTQENNLILQRHLERGKGKTVTQEQVAAALIDSDKDE